VLHIFTSVKAISNLLVIDNTVLQPCTMLSCALSHDYFFR